jgi:hypothetical protein
MGTLYCFVRRRRTVDNDFGDDDVLGKYVKKSFYET